ncbi:xylulose kinase-1 [Tanacetum coccineum]
MSGSNADAPPPPPPLPQSQTLVEVIQKGNGPINVSTDTHGIMKVLPPKTTEETLARERERKARTTLLLALPEDHLAKFHKMTDAKEMWETIKSRFGGNEESKKNKANDNSKRLGKKEESNALMTLDGGCVDWTSHSEDEQDNYAFMACNNSGSNTEVTFCSKECKESYAKLKKLYDAQRELLSDASIEIKAYTQGLNKVEAQLVAHQQGQLWYEEKIRFMKIDLDDKTDVLTYHKKLLAEAQKEKEDLKAKVEKWHNSSKSLGKLLNTQMSANDKFGLGYGDHRFDGILSYENEVLQSVFMNKESELENQPLYDRFVTAGGMHVVPPPMTGNYMPSRPDIEIDYSKFTYVSESVVNEPNVVCQPKVWSDAPIIEEYESDTDDYCLVLLGKRETAVKPSAGIIHIRALPETNASLKGISEKEDGILLKTTCTAIWSFLNLRHDVSIAKMQVIAQQLPDLRKMEALLIVIYPILTRRLEIPALEDIYQHPTDGIFTNSSYDDEGAVADFTNLESVVNFKIQKVWILVDLPYGKKIIGTKWVYRNKKDERGVVVRNKASIRIFLAFASYMGFIVYQMDVKSAFLYGKIDEEVYVSQPPGFIDPKYPQKVYKVVKALYGLHQAPRAWFPRSTSKDLSFSVVKNFRYLQCKPKLGSLEIQMYPIDLESYTDKTILEDRLTAAQLLWARFCGFKSNVLKIHTDDNVADLLTKAFDVSRFQFLVVSIGMINP